MANIFSQIRRQTRRAFRKENLLSTVGFAAAPFTGGSSLLLTGANELLKEKKDRDKNRKARDQAFAAQEAARVGPEGNPLEDLPTTLPTLNDPKALAAGISKRRKVQRKRGRRATILTSFLGGGEEAGDIFRAGLGGN